MHEPFEDDDDDEDAFPEDNDDLRRFRLGDEFVRAMTIVLLAGVSSMTIALSVVLPLLLLLLDEDEVAAGSSVVDDADDEDDEEDIPLVPGAICAHVHAICAHGFSLCSRPVLITAATPLFGIIHHTLQPKRNSRYYVLLSYHAFR